MNYNERLRLVRELANMTQKEIGDIIGISHVSVGNLENNKNKMTVDKLIEICRYFDISADFLLFGENDSENMKKIMEKRI